MPCWLQNEFTIWHRNNDVSRCRHQILLNSGSIIQTWNSSAITEMGSTGSAHQAIPSPLPARVVRWMHSLHRAGAALSYQWPMPPGKAPVRLVGYLQMEACSKRGCFYVEMVTYITCAPEFKTWTCTSLLNLSSKQKPSGQLWSMHMWKNPY